MSAGSTLSPAWCWEWGWSSSLRGLWAASRDLCLIFPSSLPPALSSEQQLPGAPSRQSRLSLAQSCSSVFPPSLSFPGCCPPPSLTLPWLCLKYFLPAPYLAAFFGEKAVVVSLGLSHGSPQELPVAVLWEQPCSFSCTFKTFPHVAFEDTLIFSSGG